MVLMVLPVAFNNRNAARQEIGIDSSTEIVPRSRSQEDQDHHRGQHQADAAFTQHVCDCGLHILRLVEDHRRTSELGTSSRFLMRSRTPFTIWMVLLFPPCFKIGR